MVPGMHASSKMHLFWEIQVSGLVLPGKHRHLVQQAGADGLI